VCTGAATHSDSLVRALPYTFLGLCKATVVVADQAAKFVVVSSARSAARRTSAPHAPAPACCSGAPRALADAAAQARLSGLRPVSALAGAGAAPRNPRGAAGSASRRLAVQ
jgi:hypothetical protein